MQIAYLKKLTLNAVVGLSVMAAGALVSCDSCTTEANISEVEKNFENPDGLTDIAVYWYWLNDNISIDGVEKDLEAMKRVGITRAYIGFQGIDDIPQGEVAFQTEEWWNVVEAALAKASELGIEIGIFNSPGWSQSGGPWVTPEQAMKHIESASLTVTGNNMVHNILLPEIADAVGDIAVIAYPAPNRGAKSVKTTAKKSENKPMIMELNFGEKATPSSLKLSVSTPFRTTGTVEALEEGVWQKVKEFPIERYNAELHVGFKPYAPVIVALPEVTAEQFRLILPESPYAGEVEAELTEALLLESYAEKSMAKMFQEPLPLWADYMWDAQPQGSRSDFAINPENMVNLTDKVSADGKTLEWMVPDGEWEITVLKSRLTGVTNSPTMPDARGLEIDKMSKKAVSEHFDAFIGKILERIPAEKRTSFKYVISDSYEVGGQNWTEDFIEAFENRYGYSPLPFMPVLEGKVVVSRDASDRFLWDMRRMVADRLADDYMTGLREKANQNGLKLWLENYGHWGYTGEFLQYGSRADEVSGEFWSEGNLGDIENRGAASCAHIYGKKVVWSESCTSGVPAFSRYPAIMKQRVDRFFTEGINSTLLHLYIQQKDDTQPGLAAWFGNEFNRNNVWFDQLDNFLLYLKRCNYVLQQGKYVADAAYFIGEDAPKMTGICDPELPYGYSFDFINAEVLLGKAKVKNGKLCLESGMEYSVLVLPAQKTMRPEMMEKVAEFVKEGLTVVGPAPVQSPSYQNYPEADKQVQTLAAELWKEGENPVKYGKGQMFAEGTSLEKVFANLGLQPDFSVAPMPVMPMFIHRELRDAEIYFVSNQADSTVIMTPSFRVENKSYTPQLWNPQTGEISPLPEFTRNDDGTISVPLRFAPIESVFVVFRKNGETSATKNIPEETEIAELAGPWQVSFQKERRGPESVVMETLIPLNESENDSIRYYSGKTHYAFNLELSELPEGNLWLDLGEVMVMGKVKVNGQYVGGVWTAPRRVKVDNYIREGNNLIEIETVNNWKNRMIFDDSLPVEQRLTSTNQWNYRFGDELQRSGLIGPVKLIQLNR